MARRYVNYAVYVIWHDNVWPNLDPRPDGGNVAPAFIDQLPKRRQGPRGGRVNIRVKAMNDGNAELLGWMLAPTDPRDFTLKFQNTIDGKDMKQLKGTGCYCVKYKEYWADGEEHYEDIEIVCQKLENGPVAFENPWR